MRSFYKIFLFTFLMSNVYSQGALNYDGVDDYVQTDYLGVLGDKERSIEAWIRTPSVMGTILDYGEFNSPNGRRFTLTVNNVGNLRIEIRGWGINGTTDLTDNEWHHVAATFDGTIFTLYVDGVVEASGTSTETVNTTTSTSNTPGLRMGNRSDLGGGFVNYFEGDIDEVRFWDVALTGADILANKDIEIPGTTANLTGYWKLNETSGATAIDDSNGMNDGTLNDFALDGSGISDWTSDSALPVDLVSFDAKYDGKDVLLNWTTSTEINNSGFEIEHSVNGQEFKRLNFVEGHGTTYQTKNYSYTDHNPKEGNNFYRLLQLDFDGNKNYSSVEVVSVQENETLDLEIYPNHVNETLFIHSYDEVSNAVLYNAFGQQLQNIKLENSISTFDMTEYPSGQYFLVINNGNQRSVKQVIK